MPRATERLLLSKPLASRVDVHKDPTFTLAYSDTYKALRDWEWRGLIDVADKNSALGVTTWEKHVVGSNTKGDRSEPQKNVYAAVAIQRPVQGELSLVYLRIMRELAVRHAVPFKEIPDTPALRLPAELVPIHEKLRAYALAESPSIGLTREEWLLLRRRYIHLSANWNAAKDFNNSNTDILFINRPALNQQRVIHPNE